ncbi:hypothetical protein HDU67_006144 [Dinochytrium kinnereticum]|nr:hypothetical protein HDU67_006144 [Dinochytrium kinnereticum]
MAKIVPAEQKLNPSFFGYVGQLNVQAYEGLTCNFLEWVASNGGGFVLDQKNLSVTVNNPNAVDIVKRMKSWLSPAKSYTPLASLVYDEQISERGWLKGPTFPRNSKGQPAFGMTRIPGKTKDMSAATLGGFQLAVNKYTKNINASVRAIQAMMTPEFQMKRLEVAKVWPTIPSLFKDIDSVFKL